MRIGFKEARYIAKYLREVRHVTLNPYGPGVIRIHMVPPKSGAGRDVPYMIILNGQDILPLNLSWAILLSAFIDEITLLHGKEIPDADWDALIGRAVKKVHKVYPIVRQSTLCKDLWRILNTFIEIAEGKEPQEEIGVISIGEYAQHMQAPHRMDLMISAMTKDSRWNCNQQCIHCYAANQELAGAEELPTESWKTIIQKCRDSGIPQLTFTGGEPTLRDDLALLVDYAKWFITRLNTNGVLLTKELCQQLYEASLDSVQVTLYSGDPRKHNNLVGAENWEKTIAGIRNALEAGLDVSVNTPLCNLNGDYIETLKFLKELGVCYVTCSGLILTGNALKQESAATQLTSEELYGILQDACKYCSNNHIELSFTSPGLASETRLREIGLMSIPTCGACLSNMAIVPDGRVVPCQSWLSDESLGNMLADPWDTIWNGTRCREIRMESAKMEQVCQLRGKKAGNTAICG